MTKKKQDKQGREPVDFDAFQQINLNAAGIDIGSDEIYVAVPVGRDKESVRAFGTFTVDLHQVAQWLQACGIETVAMESTGVYWIPLYEILESYGSWFGQTVTNFSECGKLSAWQRILP